MRFRVRVLTCLLSALPFTAMSWADDISVTAGAQITPNKTAVENGTWPQDSRPGPSAGIIYRHWFTGHQGIAFEADYANVNTQLQNFSLNTWTMNRVSLDGAYEFRWQVGKFSPYIKAGVGTLVTLSGRANPPGQGWVGMDDRMEEIAGAGFTYKLSRRFSFLTEYECHLFLNPDFSDHGWHPQRDEVSEPKIGLTYTFGGER